MGFEPPQPRMQPFSRQCQNTLAYVLREEFKKLTAEVKRLSDPALTATMENFTMSLASYASELSPFLLGTRRFDMQSGFDILNKKPVFVHGSLGQNRIYTTENVHNIAREVGVNLFNPKPQPETLIILKTEYWPEFNGFIVLLTDGTTKYAKH